jgi:hypothetical protein
LGVVGRLLGLGASSPERAGTGRFVLFVLFFAGRLSERLT